MSHIFISYRRADSIAESGRIHDHLEREFGGRHVFKDVDDIRPGLDFRKVLEEEVARCDVLLAIIGQSWATTTDADGNRRLHNPDDFVRIEVESGLKRGDDVLVIPVLVNNATMPSIHDLPESLHEITYRNAVIIRNDPDFNRDMRRLIDHIYRYRKQNRPNRTPLFIGGFAVIAVVALAIIGLLGASSGAVQSTVTPSDVPPSVTPEIGNRESAEQFYASAQTNAGNADYETAIDNYTEAIDADPTYATAYVGRALASASGYGDLSSAITDLEQAVSLDPTYAEAFSYLGQYQYYEGVYDTVEANLTRAIELNPADTDARDVLADYYIDVSRYADASNQYRAILDQKDSIPPDKVYEAHIGLAYSASAQGQIDEAIAGYQTAIELDPERGDAYSSLGNIYTYRGDYDSALASLNIAYEKLPDNPDIIYNRGLAHFYLQNYGEALADFERTLQLDPGKVPAYVMRGRVYHALDNYVSAVSDFSQAITRDEDDGNAYYWRGITHFDEKNYALAVDDLTQAIDLEALTANAYAYRGLARLELAEPDSAREDLEQALAYGLEDDIKDDVLIELGWLAFDEADDASALNYFSEASVINPANPSIYEGQAVVFLLRAEEATSDNEKINHLLSALDMLNRAIDRLETPTDSLYLNRADVYTQLGFLTDDEDQLQQAFNDYQQATSGDESSRILAYQGLAELALNWDTYSPEDASGLLRFAYELDDKNADTLGLFGAIYEELGDTDSAIRYYEDAVENAQDEETRTTYQAELDRLTNP